MTLGSCVAPSSTFSSINSRDLQSLERLQMERTKAAQASNDRQRQARLAAERLTEARQQVRRCGSESGPRRIE